MRRLPRLQQSVDCLIARPSPQICNSCRRRLNLTPFNSNTRAFSSSTIHAKTTSDRVKTLLWKKGETPEEQLKKTESGTETKSVEIESKEATLAEQKPVDETRAGIVEAKNKYKPAETWKGLKWVGGKKFAAETDYNQFLEEAGEFQGYTPPLRLTDAKEITDTVHDAVKELLLVEAFKISLQNLGQYDELDSLLDAVTIEVAENGQAYSLVFDSPESKRKALELFKPSESVKAKLAWQGPSELTLSSEIKTDDQAYVLLEQDGEKTKPAKKLESWKNLNISSLPVKFALTKYLIYVTGLRARDAHLHTTHTTGRLLTHLIAASNPERPKLADILEEDSTISTLGNVQIVGKRVTPIDKEKAVGRWKIIVEELEKRDLPVTGF